jgi:hypothetical protein
MGYLEQFRGRFIGIMQWQDCNDLLGTLKSNPDEWYIYNTDEVVPSETATPSNFISQLNGIKEILTTQHQERYCGIVYTDNLDKPSFVKIFHPKNLGKVCGYSDNPPLPRWVLSKTKPIDVVQEFGTPKVETGFISKLFKF